MELNWPWIYFEYRIFPGLVDRTLWCRGNILALDHMSYSHVCLLIPLCPLLVQCPLSVVGWQLSYFLSSQFKTYLFLISDKHFNADLCAIYVCAREFQRVSAESSFVIVCPAISMTSCGVPNKWSHAWLSRTWFPRWSILLSSGCISRHIILV